MGIGNKAGRYVMTQAEDDDMMLSKVCKCKATIIIRDLQNMTQSV
jgi:hypothetical protein